MIESYPFILDQYHYEHQAWERILDFTREESAMLKTRLSRVLDLNTDKDFLRMAEQFQNWFLNKDDCIDELKKDLRQLERLCEKLVPENKVPGDVNLKAVHTRIRNEMESFELNFMQLKNRFNKYLASLE